MRKEQDRIASPIIKELEENFILNLSLLHFIMICSLKDSEEKEKFIYISVGMDIGRKMMRKYLYTFKCKDPDFKKSSYSN